MRHLSAQVKIHQTLQEQTLKEQISCSSNFASLFSVMRHNSSVLYCWNFIYFQEKEPIKVQIWWTFTSDILHFDGLLLSKWYEVSAKKCTEELPLMTLKSDAKFKEKLIFGFKYDMKKLVNFHQASQKSENFTSMGSFCPKYIRFEPKKYKGVIFHNTEPRCKIWISPELVVLKMAWGFEWTLIRALKSLKNFILIGFFYPNNMIYQLKISRGIMCHGNERWCKT